MLPRATRPFHFWFSSHVKCVKCCSPVLASLLTLLGWRISKKELSSLAATTKGGVAKALQALTDFYPQLQFESWKSPEPGIKKKEKRNSFPSQSLLWVFETCQPESKDADGGAQKRGLTWAHGPEGSMAGNVSPPPPVLLPSTTKLNISGG